MGELFSLREKLSLLDTDWMMAWLTEFRYTLAASGAMVLAKMVYEKSSEVF